MIRPKVFAWVLATLMSGQAVAEPVVTIRATGPSANRVDLVVLGDGYTQADLVKFGADVERIVSRMFAQEPYAGYESYFNVHRVDVASAESGVDHLERNVRKDTALGAAYGCSASYTYYICIDFAAINTVLARSVAPTERDIVLVIVNDTQYGGSGGAIAAASLSPESVELVLHELGHSFGLLADEYVGGGTCRSGGGREPQQANATRAIARETIKWSRWIDPRTALPTADLRRGTVGAYLGADHCSDTFYRPTYESKMRTFGTPFEAVNTEQLIKRIYNFVSPIERISHERPEVLLAAGEVTPFWVERLRPRDLELSVQWTLDGRPVGADPTFSLDARTLTPGQYALELEVRDPTPAVRSDPAEALIERRRWTLTIAPR